LPGDAPELVDTVVAETFLLQVREKSDAAGGDTVRCIVCTDNKRGVDMARKLSTTVATGLSAVLLASCAGTQLEDTRNLDPQGSAFNAALYNGYVERSQHEYDYGDYETSDQFARRAQQAAAGQTVQPLPVDGGELTVDEPSMQDSKLPALREARNDLTAVLRQSARSKAPEAAAEAQVAYDCWVEESQPDHIQACRTRFNSALQTAQDAVGPEQAESASQTAPAAPDQQEAPEPESFTVYFGFDSAQLSAEARDVLSQVANAADDRPDAEISATGFTDTVGPEDYNQDLSFRRAQAVKQALSGRGIDADRIGTAARGENQLAVDTADGVREPRNRRVEISLF
jgi:OOP family OmpA-OmpF porin